jgi:hypothetical protein
VDWNRVEGNWKQMKGKIKEKWGNLTDELFYEQISKIGFDCLQRPTRNPQLIAERRSA